MRENTYVKNKNFKYLNLKNRKIFLKMFITEKHLII